MKRQVTVSIAGLKFALRSDGDDGVVQQLAGDVDRRIRTIQKSSRGVDSQQVAILAALQLAEELHQEKDRQIALKKKIRDKGRTLLKLLNAVS